MEAMVLCVYTILQFPSPGESCTPKAPPVSPVPSGAPRTKHAHAKKGVPWQTFKKRTIRYVKSSLS